MMELTLARNTAVILWSLAPALGLIAAVALGALDGLAADGAFKRTTAVGSVIVAWVVFFGVVWLIPFAIRHPRHTALAMISTAATLGLLEMALPALLPGTTAVSLDAGGFQSREFHHIYPPLARRYMGRFEGADVFLDTNEDGLRTTYSREEFRKHDHRVIFLGDSFTFGLGVTSEETFPSRVEARLQQALAGESVAVLNAGIVSYSPFLQKLLLEKKLIDYRPTLVVLFLDVTDIGDDYAHMNLAEWSNGTWVFPFEERPPLAYRGAVGELARPYQRRLMSALTYPLELAGFRIARYDSRDYYDFKIQIGTVVETNRFFIYRHPLDSTRQFFDETLRNVDEIAALAGRIGAGFALAITPRYHHWNADECPDNWERNEYGTAEPYQFEYFRYFDEVHREYPIINLLPDFLATDEYPLVFADDPHWNAAGHAFVADTITRYLLSGVMVQPLTTSWNSAPRW